MNINYLDRVSSTNAYLLEKPEKDRVGCVVWAGEQTAGKGMGSNVWESAPGANLTFSMGVDMSFMKAADQFLLSQAVPLGLLDVLDGMLPSDGGAALTVKWPNDLYYGNRKLGGILINSAIHGMDMGVSVIGIGLNVNQMRFLDWPVQPVSLKMVLGEDLALEPLLRRLVEAVGRRVSMLQTEEGVTSIRQDYLSRLYRYHVWADYAVNGLKVRRFITGIDAFGRLETLDESGERHIYDIKEIRF
ncbi:MAG: biotin--[Bacteroidales bacterium]|nr:biotin--[acetyl-CoA-carboxylase] ligase [Bacteroidales bacterium]